MSHLGLHLSIHCNLQACAVLTCVNNEWNITDSMDGVAHNNSDMDGLYGLAISDVQDDSVWLCALTHMLINDVSINHILQVNKQGDSVWFCALTHMLINDVSINYRKSSI